MKMQMTKTMVLISLSLMAAAMLLPLYAADMPEGVITQAVTTGKRPFTIPPGWRLIHVTTIGLHAQFHNFLFQDAEGSIFIMKALHKEKEIVFKERKDGKPIAHEIRISSKLHKSQ